MSDSKTNAVGARQSILDGIQKGDDANKIASFLTGVLVMFANGLAIPWMMAFHHNVGERVVTFKHLLWGHICLSPSALLIGSEGAGGLITLYYISWGCQKVAVLRRRKKKERIHSRHPGDSWLTTAFRAQAYLSWLGIKPFGAKFIECVIEPLVVVYCVTVLGLVFGQEAVSGAYYHKPAIGMPQFGLFGLISGAALALVQVQRYNVARNMYLDQIDQQITAEELARALDGDTDIAESSSYVLPDADTLSAEERAAIKSTILESDPQLEALLRH